MNRTFFEWERLNSDSRTTHHPSIATGFFYVRFYRPEARLVEVIFLKLAKGREFWLLSPRTAVGIGWCWRPLCTCSLHRGAPYALR